MPTQSFPAAWALTPIEAAYLTKLRSGAVVGVPDLSGLHSRIPPGTDPTGRVRRTMRHLRRKLDPFDIEIETKWGQGWQLGQAARAKITGLMKR